MRLNKLWLPALAGLIAWLGFTVQQCDLQPAGGEIDGRGETRHASADHRPRAARRDLAVV